ncbi:HTH-type transcriptional regulatory protein RaaS [Aestuariimicrobium sp. T2.26MG-19.2B]|nr:HTH-type transcriptional regulatory protein RaaS [Aestuariimicrobium sp. T2.26MG-19.2B]
MVNMSSMTRPDDLTPQARIRNAALELFGDLGYDRTTVRQVAQRAGVSAGLVIHHFGSKEGLRQSCDDWVTAVILDEKAIVSSGGSLPQLQVYLSDHPELAPIMNYLVASLKQGGEMASSVFDRLCAVTSQLLDEGIAAGTMREPTDREAAIATMVAFSTGASVLGPLIAARLGGTTLLDPGVYQRYAVAALELFTHGLLTDSHLLDQARPVPSERQA